MKEKILDRNYKPRMHWKSVNRENVLKAMKEFADYQQTIHYHKGYQDGFADGELHNTKK